MDVLKKVLAVLKQNIKWVILFVCLIIFILFLEDVFEKEIIMCDVIAYRIIVEKLRVDWLTGIMKIVTKCGGVFAITIVTILSIICVRNRKISLGILCNVLTITGLNVLLKNVIQRARPVGIGLIIESGYSFPSGHSMVSMAFYGLIMYYGYMYIKNRAVRNIFCSVLALLILLIGISRIYLGVHYASDVIGGFVLSISYFIVFASIQKSINNRKVEEDN